MRINSQSSSFLTIFEQDERRSLKRSVMIISCSSESVSYTHLESIFETLKNGDQIEIITSDNSRPNLEWLDHVTTAKAKQSITTYLKRSRENNIRCV